MRSRNHTSAILLVVLLSATLVPQPLSATLQATDSDSPAPQASPASPCAALGSSMLALETHTNAATRDAAEAGISADGLPKNNAFRAVEGDSVKVNNEVIQGYMALGPILAADDANQGIMNATAAVAAEAHSELQLAQIFTDVALTFERNVNAGRDRLRRTLVGLAIGVVAPVAGLAYLGARGIHQSASSSTTSGTVNGQPFSATTTATTTTVNYAEIDALRSVEAAALDKQKMALELYGPQVTILPYALDPLIDRWVAACKSAHELGNTR